MNVLSYLTSTENKLSFELLVDGLPLHELVDGESGGIPYWIIDDDLPYFPPRGEPRKQGIHIVCVCSCGEYGCGHTQCRVERYDDVVIWRDFDQIVGEAGRRVVFEFSHENYDAVVADIVAHARSARAPHK